jgi:polar amino acid transport system substrate-binding protein
MRRLTRARLLLLALLAAPLLAGAAHAAGCTPLVAVPPDQLVTPGKLQLSINPTRPPQQYVDTNGDLQGLNVELGNELARRLCLEMVHVRMDFPPMVPALQAGRFDGINTGFFWTEARAKLFYLVPYALQSISVVVPVKSGLKITSLDDLAGKTVVIEVNTYQERWLKGQSDEMVARGKAPIVIHGFTTATEAMAALRAGQGDAAALLDYMAADLTKRGVVETELFRLGGAPTAMAFRSKAVADAVVAALTAMRADGSYTKLFEKFGLTPQPADQPFAIRGPGPT